MTDIAPYCAAERRWGARASSIKMKPKRHDGAGACGCNHAVWVRAGKRYFSRLRTAKKQVLACFRGGMGVIGYGKRLRQAQLTA